MPSFHRGEGSLDAFVRPGVVTIAENPPLLLPNTRSRSPMKRPRVESDPESDDEDETNADRMDFQHPEDTAATQATGGTDNEPAFGGFQLPPPLSPEHTAIHADFETITASAMEQLYRRITTDINASVSENTAAFLRTNSELRQQVSLLNARITQMQQQTLVKQKNIQPPTTAPAVAAVKKVLKKKLEKKSTGEDAARTSTTDSTTPRVPSTTPQNLPTSTRGWETVPPRTKPSTPKLIPTKYPQAEREVTCFFENNNTSDTITEPEKTYTERQTMADMALHRINTAFVDNKDVLVPPFIRARVTMRGAIVFTTGNDQNNVVYEDYITIIKHALSPFGKCERVEIGKRFSQFLLHGVPTHLSIPDISHSISTNYPQLVQGQTPRWLTPADRREHKTNSTIVMTLTGNIKKADVGRQNLIVGNRECQLDDYISYGRSTQCRNCQTYGHPAALCRKDPCCAVCAGTHKTSEHPCTLPICRKGPTCTHPPILCVNCNAPDKASDPNCPVRIKLRTFNQVAAATHLGDAPMAEVAN